MLDQRLEHVRGEVAAADAGVDGVDQLVVLGVHAVAECGAPGWQCAERCKRPRAVSSPAGRLVPVPGRPVAYKRCVNSAK